VSSEIRLLHKTPVRPRMRIVEDAYANEIIYAHNRYIDIRGISARLAHSQNLLFFFFLSSSFLFFNTEPTTFARPWELVLSPNRFIDYIRNGGWLIFESIIFEIQIRKHTLRYYCHRDAC